MNDRSKGGMQLALDTDSLTALVAAVVWFFALLWAALQVAKWHEDGFWRYWQFGPPTPIPSEITAAGFITGFLLPAFVIYLCVVVLRSNLSKVWKLGAVLVAVDFSLALLGRLPGLPRLAIQITAQLRSALGGLLLVVILVGVPLWFRSRVRYV